MMIDPKAAAFDYNTLMGVVVMGVFTLGIFYFLAAMVRIHLGMGRENALAFSALVTAVGIGSGVYYATHVGAANPTQGILGPLSAVFFVVIGVPLAVKIYRAWMGVKVTAAEGTPGAVGFRAWLSPLKLVVAVLISACAYGAYHIPVLEGLGVTLMLLLAYPIGNSLGANAQPTTAGADLGPERERVLSMLEAGKITAEESAELLGVLASTAPTPRAPRRFSPGERQMLFGAAVVLLGFFLPWYQVNLGQEMQRMMGTLNGSAGQMSFQNLMPKLESAAGVPSGSFAPQNGAMGMPNTPTVSITGGDMVHGLGWVVLFGALGAAILPFFGNAMEPELRRLLTVLALGVGMIILLYLISSGLRYVSAGLVLAAVGYVLEITALVRPTNAGGRLPASVPVRS